MFRAVPRHGSALMPLVGAFTKRTFSMTASKNVVANAIFMPEMYPAKLQVPTRSGELYEFTADHSMTVESFKA